jgi:hypothetical protein
VGCQNSVASADQQFSRCPFVLVDQDTQDRTPLDLFVAEICHGVSRSWRAKFAGSVRSPTVVVPDVVREHHTQVPLTEDQYAVDESGSDRADEPFGEIIRPRTTRRNLDYANADVSKDNIKGRAELTGPISDEKPELREAIAQIYHQVAELLRRPPAVRVRGHTQQVHRPASDFQRDKHLDPLERHRAVHMEKSHTSIVDAWARRNCCQVVSVSRAGAGGIRSRLRTRRIVEAPTRWPSLSSSPWIL